LPDVDGFAPDDLAFSPDERWLAAAYSGAREIHVWPREGGEPRVLSWEGGGASDLGFGQQSNLLAAAFHEDDTHARIWSVQDGVLRHALRGEVGP
jgi:WD40 repeat protein